jgi:hypothetical protein
MGPKTACMLVAAIFVAFANRVSAQDLADDRYAQNPQPTRLPAAAAQQPSIKNQVQLQQTQIELQQQQIETLQGMVRQLQQAVPPATVGELQNTTAELESRSVRAAGRDQELARAVDDLNEKLDNLQRYGPQLPANLKQFFLPSATNETPLSIYGELAADYTDIGNAPPNFDAELATFFLLGLNDQFYLEGEVGFSGDGAELSQAQLDWILNDHATLVIGRFLVPIGFFNERLDPTWINKLPDAPLMFRQVTPTGFSENGLQLRGSTYLGCSPIKLEYSTFVTNGMGVEGDNPDLTHIANLGDLTGAFDNINNSLAFGSRLGFWVPEYGLTGGASVLANGSYTQASGNDLAIWQLDSGWREGNWDLRAEYAQMFQDAKAIIGQNIERRGLYAQVGYRPYDACSEYLQNTEFLFRYSFANFKGINPADLDVADFATTIDLPVDRNQYTFGIDYWLYPSLVFKLAYEINDETGTSLHDNAFLAQMAWGF